MNIITAVLLSQKTERRMFRRKYPLRSFTLAQFENYCSTADDILADDWELEDQAVEFTESELASLLKSYVGDARFNGMLYSEALNAIVADIFERKIKGSITE